MNTRNVKNQPLLRRLALFVAVVSLSGLVVWGLRGNSPSSSAAADSSPAEQTRSGEPTITAHGLHPTISVGKGGGHDDCAHCAKSGSKTAAPTIAEVIGQLPPTNNPVVADLIQRFRQGDRTISSASFESLKTRPIGKRVSVTAGGIDWNGILDSRTDGAEVFHYGITLDDGLGRFQLSLREDQRMQAAILFHGENLVLAANGLPENGTWQMETSTLEQVICAPAGTVYAPDGGSPEAVGSLKAADTAGGGSAGPLSALPLLSSKPDSTFVLYMDFDGEVVTHPGWNNGKTINAEPDPRAEDATYVTNVWKRVAEDFAGFDLNVTTDRAAFDAAAVSHRVICVCTPTNDAAPGAGGVAYLDSFGQDTPCWNFNIGSEYASADTISHEIGHTLGLRHDGTTDGVEYYGGHGGTGPYSWSPIMGAAWANANYEEVTSWSKGEYPKANNKEDDLSMITSNNGFGYQLDDKGNTQETATDLKIVEGKVADSGIIERTDDLDWLSFITTGGSVLLNLNVTDVDSSESPQRGSNLALSAELYDAAGTLLQSSNEADSPDATISINLDPGTYFIKLDGVGRGTLATGFPEYASIGQYYISGTIPQEDLITITPKSATFSSKTSAGSFDVSSEREWSWVCDESWVTSSEPRTQTGDQKFDYTVRANTDADPRTARIVLSVGGYSITHTITQEARGADDHSNFINGATVVGQNSITDGVIEIEGDLDVFQIRVPQFGDLSVESSGPTNTFGEILDYNGVPVASNDNALLPNFKITRAVSPGTYYVRVRHALSRGVGPYKMVARFNSTALLSVNPDERSVAASAAEYGFSVVCNSVWTWSSDVPWLTSEEATSQYFGQRFTYSVDENTSTGRTGHITLTAGELTVVHTVSQIGVLTDDHGNTNELATSVETTDSIPGNFEAVGDVDVFKLVLPTSGDLKVSTTGSTDTYGYVLDSSGTEIVHNDDLVGINFGTTVSLDAGTYYVQVRHFSAHGTGAYEFNSTFTPSQYLHVSYTASSGGSLNGIARQSVPLGGDAKVVTAVPNTGFSFIRWSDGRALAARDDRNLQSNLAVTAEFSPTLSVAIVGGDALRDNQYPKVDFGTRWIDEIVPISFEIRNNGATPVTQLKVVKTGLHIAEWTLSTLPLTTLQPGQSTLLTATLQGSSDGYKSAFFTLSATGTDIRPFRIPVMATILDNIVIQSLGNAAPDAPQASSGDTLVGPEALPSSPPAPSLAEGLHAAAAASDCAVMISPDGLFRHRFRLTKNRRVIPDFLISRDGIDWLPADRLSVRKTGQSPTWDEFEVALSPMGLDSPVILVFEASPTPEEP